MRNFSRSASASSRCLSNRRARRPRKGSITRRHLSNRLDGLEVEVKDSARNHRKWATTDLNRIPQVSRDDAEGNCWSATSARRGRATSSCSSIPGCSPLWRRISDIAKPDEQTRRGEVDLTESTGVYPEAEKRVQMKSNPKRGTRLRAIRIEKPTVGRVERWNVNRFSTSKDHMIQGGGGLGSRV